MSRSIIASILSIIPGLGQMYLGYWRRGAVLFFSLPALAVMLWAIGQPVLIGAIGLIWVWGILDAYSLAQKREISITLPIVMALFIALVASWFITEIDLGSLVRNMAKNGGMITSQLVRPDVRAKKSIETPAAKAVLVIYEGGNKPAVPAVMPVSGPSAYFVPAAAQPNQNITLKLAGFKPGQDVVIYRGGRDIPFLELETGRNGKAEASLVNPIQRAGKYVFDARIVQVTPTWQPSETLKLTAAAVLQTVFMALLGTALSILFAIPFSFLAARNLMKGSCLGWTAYSTTRFGFNMLRSFEVLVIAVVLVQIVGPGPFAGVLALAIHGIGAIGKLYSEAIESIERGPIEAITATGANRLQVVVFGVIPQIIPQFVSFTMYRWDINVRMATVIGLVGGGGVGQLLTQYIGLTQWSRAATAIWLIAAVVMLMDYVSAVVREKLV